MINLRIIQLFINKRGKIVKGIIRLGKYKNFLAVE